VLAQAEATGEAVALVFLRAAPAAVPPDHHRRDSPADGGGGPGAPLAPACWGFGRRGANAAAGVGYRFGPPPGRSAAVAKALAADRRGLAPAAQLGKVTLPLLEYSPFPPLSVNAFKSLLTALLFFKQW
jgi:hypothetical protein